jgi:hypothetical protein
MTRPFAILFVLAAPAYAQTLVEPERAAEARQAFDSAATGRPLRCEIAPIKPVLTFGFRFQSGYRLSFPLNQFSGSSHTLTASVRVVPEGRPPVYLTTTRTLPQIADVKADGVADGLFAVGEGNYSVEVLLRDDENRACRSNWQIQAHRNGAERQLAITTPPLTVAEAEARDPT